MHARFYTQGGRNNNAIQTHSVKRPGSCTVAVLGMLFSGCHNSSGQTDTTPGNPTPGPVTSDTKTATPVPGPDTAGPNGTPGAAPSAAGKGAAAVTNQTPPPTPGGPGGTMMNKPTTNPAGVLGDAEITLRVHNALIADTNVKASAVNVDTKSQIVVLRGSQSSQAAITAAQNDAKQIKGVKQVISQLTVKP